MFSRSRCRWTSIKLAGYERIVTRFVSNLLGLLFHFIWLQGFFSRASTSRLGTGSISALEGMPSSIGYCEVIGDDPLPTYQHCHCPSRWLVSRQFATLFSACRTDFDRA